MKKKLNKNKKMVKDRKVAIGKGMKVSRAKEKKMEKRAGGSNVGEYKTVKKSDFAGPAGKSPEGSYPINTLARAKSALKLAFNAPDPEGIKRKVYSRYPQLKPKNKKKK